MKTVKKTKKRSVTYHHYLACIVIFFCVLVFSITVFSSAVWEQSDTNTSEMIMKNVQRQKEHFQIFINEQYAQLEGIADHVGRQDDLMSEDNFVLIKDFIERSTFHRITIFRPDGMGLTSDGTNIAVTQREHFEEALAGKRGMSEPLESQLDGQSLVALSVPVLEPESDVVKGVLTASYNVTLLNRLMFEDLYDGEGAAAIVSGNGQMISSTLSGEENLFESAESFFDFYSACDFRTGSFEHMKEDFASGRSDCLKVAMGEDVRYIAYMPMDLEDWMVCYAVPLSAARESFKFMTFYTRNLALVLISTVVILVSFSWLWNRRKEKALLDKAEIDALTGILNRESTVNKISEWLSADVYDEFQVFLMLDLDNFKGINDTYGHSVGDKVLRQTGAILKNAFRSSDIVGRLGGDEFVVLMKNVRMESVVNFYMSEVSRKLGELEIPELAGTKLHCSIGAAYAPNHGNTFKELYNRADAALYAVKRSGRDNGKIYSEDDAM